MTYKLIVQNTKLILKTVAGATLNFIGIKDSNTGTGTVSNNLIDWKLLHYSDTVANLTASNPVLGLGQQAFSSDLFYGATDQMQFKVGDGVQTWLNLDYMPIGSGGSYTLTTSEIGTVINGASSATPNDTDLVMSVDTSVAKKNTWTQVKAFLKTYFDTVFESLSNKATDWTVIDDTLYPTVKNVDTRINGVITSSLSFFYYKTISDIGTYYKMLQAPSTGGAQSIVALNTTGTTSIAKFITEPSQPNKLYIPIGWNRIHLHAEKVGAGNVTLLAKIFKRDLGGTETVLFTTAPTLTNLTTSVTPYDLEYYNTGIATLLATDRIGVEILSVTATGTPDVTIWIEDAFLSRVDLPSASNDMSGYELTANKSSSYTASSTTTYANTKALVDGLATKGVGTILGTVGATATFGTPSPYGSGVANTVTSSPFWSIYNSGAITKQVLANTSTSQQQGYMFEENGQYAGVYRYGSAFSATLFTGTSVAKGNTVSFESANAVNLPMIFLGNPIINGIGQTSTNVATRHDATGWRVGTMATVHTANTNLFQVGANLIYNDSGTNSFMTIGGTTNTIPLFVTNRETIVTAFNTDFDPNIVSARTITDAITTNSHGFVEATVFKSTTSNLANNAFTDNGILRDPTGMAGNYNHHASYQSQVKLNNTGTTGALYFCADAPTVNSGTLTNRYGFYFYDGVGTGVITNQYGLYVPTLAKGSTLNEAIHVATNDSYFGGKLKMVTTSGGANVEAPQVSWYHASTIKTSYITDKIINNTSELKFNVSTYNFAGYKEMLTLRGDDTNTSADYAIINSSKLGLYNVTPIARATTGGTASTFVANTSLIANDTATFDGYTIGQVVKALRNLGILT